MRSDYLEIVHMKRLEKLIDKLRDILNEICSASNCADNTKERLIISQCLDQLIVEYMNNLHLDNADETEYE